MIPILYEATETAFTSNGLGRLADCISCRVREVRNGEYVLTMQYPVTGSLYSEIKVGRRIGAIHDDNHDVQPFIVYGHSKPINGVVTFYAWHLSYLLKYVVVRPFTTSTCAAAMAAMKSQAYGENKFNFWTDKSVSATYKNQHPASVRSLLAGEENSLLDVYGTGEFEFDKWAVKLHLHRGSNKGVSIRYGVNMTGFQQDVDSQEMYNAVAPFWMDGETGIATTLPEGFVLVGTPQTTIVPWTSNTGAYMTDNNDNLFEFKVPDLKVHPLDLTERFETKPTVDQLRAAAISAASTSAPWLPTENIKLSYAEQGSEFEPLLSVCLCDEISVYCGPLGVGATSMEVVSLEYDTLNERNVTVEVGVLKSSFADTIRKATLSSAMTYANAIAAAKTNTLDLSLTQQEIFDRLTDGGLEQGLALESPYAEGPSAAGDKKLYLNLDYAKFGKLIADFIQGGILTLGGADNVNGELRILDESGVVIGTWNKDGIIIRNGSILADVVKGGTLTLGGNENVNGQVAILDSDGEQVGTWGSDGLYIGDADNHVKLLASVSYEGGTPEVAFYAKSLADANVYTEVFVYDGMLIVRNTQSDYEVRISSGRVVVEGNNHETVILPTGIEIDGETGVTGTFRTADNKTVIVTSGLITGIA